ncbi:hypothetical protein BRCON_0277 [Candidatus Sumerlaea chitinivorans]|uniref:Uncharacterized protein n=1 Tax=Sumerlaea chitinivorans TaxID=2250252 RepID=A0A2Z4Y1Z9_SUMC1|nr:hypothetical protein BRCON_0277 [Candidatus Sumerlaea chitinivorans]
MSLSHWRATYCARVYPHVAYSKIFLNCGVRLMVVPSVALVF